MLRRPDSRQSSFDSKARKSFLPPRSGVASVNNWLVAFLLILVAILLYRLTDAGRNIWPPINDPDATSRTVSPSGGLADDEKNTIEIFQNTAPSVVYISTSQIVPSRSVFSGNYLKIPQGTGSGFIWDTKGNIVTNYHVVKPQRGVGSFMVRLSNSDQDWEARVVGVAPEYDLAVLKINAPAHLLTPLAIGTSEDLQVGQKVFAIGNPFGLDHTLTTGVISGLGRQFQSSEGHSVISDAIQTDTAINPGNSGGPLLDSSARMIGINTAIYSETGSYAGVGFAIPVDTVNIVVPDLIQNGRIDRPGLGIVMLPDHGMIQTLRYNLIEREGVIILDVVEGGTAQQAGLRGTKEHSSGLVLGDLIIGINGYEVKSRRDLLTALHKYQIGEEVEVKYIREGEEASVKVKLMPLQQPVK